MPTRSGGGTEATLSSAQEDVQLWHAPEVYWAVADHSLHVVKTFRVQVVRDEAPQKKKAKQAVQQESTNYYTSNLKLGSIPPRFMPDPAGAGRSCWRMDTEVFQTLATQAHLKQSSVHQTCALVVLTMIRVLAYTLSLVFYHR
jgi:hypothetical protein